MTFPGFGGVTDQEWHAILVHFPIALAIAGVPLVYVTAVIAADRAAIRWVTVALYLAVAAGAYAAWWSGQRAKDHVLPSYPDQVWQTLLTHEKLAEVVWIGALVTALLVLLGAITYKVVRVGAMTLAMITSVVTAAIVGFTAHYGGQLVYRYGVGTPSADLLYASPAPPPELAPTPAPQPQDTGDEASHTPATNGTAPAPEATSISIRPISMDEAQLVDYQRDVVPILGRHCLECHLEDKMEGDLLLSTVEDMLIGGKKAGPAIIPGDPDDSPLILYIRGIMKPQMPKRQPPLSEEEVHILRMWIHAGATGGGQADAPVVD